MDIKVYNYCRQFPKNISVNFGLEYHHTLLLVPTSSMTGSVCSGGIPPKAVYRASFPTGIPIP